MPARKPTVTGTDSRSAIQPRRKMPPTTSTTPTMSASTPASAAYSGEPDTASKARPPAKIGVMVESAPLDSERLLPKMAKASEPARNAKNPICGENPPSRAVASCSGIAIAASVSPATRSCVRNQGRYPLSERNTGQPWMLVSQSGSWSAGGVDHECVASPKESSVLATAGDITGNFSSCPSALRKFLTAGGLAPVGFCPALFKIRRFLQGCLFY